MSRVSSIRSAAQATFSAPRQIPIRWRLAGGSALLTLVILCGFAGAVGGLTSQRLHEDFDREVSAAADLLQARIKYNALVPGTEPNSYELDGLSPPLAYYDDGQTIVRIILHDGVLLDSTSLTKDFGPPRVKRSEHDGYLVETREIPREGDDIVYNPLYLQYARPLASVDATVGRLRLFLIVGVLSGAGLALLAGVMVARRAMAPIAALTATARKIERTRDPAEKIPAVEADDEVADGHELSIDANRAFVDGARDELHRLTLNLVENAIGHTPTGTEVRASVERVEGQVRLTVEDDGPGIPADLKDRVFERFVRGVGDRGGSSGLGLSIVHAVAESHGGTVTVVSPAMNGASRPHGTRFEVTLPASSSPQHTPEPATADSV